MADCAAAPSLFYSDWVEEIDERVSTAEGYCTIGWRLIDMQQREVGSSRRRREL
jgi:hypothetical protein